MKANPDWYDALSVSYPQQTADILRRGTDASSDLYALAATLYQLLTNHLPVNAPPRALALWAGEPDKLRSAHKVNAQVSKEVSDVLQGAMKIDRRERPISAAQMRRKLKEAVQPIDAVDPVPIVNNFAEPMTKTTLQEFKAEPIKPVSTDEAPRSPDLPAKVDKLKNSLPLYMALIALPLLLVTVGLVVYFNQFPSNTKTANTNLAPLSKNINSVSHQPVVDVKYELAHTRMGGNNSVDSVAFSPDGKTIVSGSFDHTIKLWASLGHNC